LPTVCSNVLWWLLVRFLSRCWQSSSRLISMQGHTERAEALTSGRFIRRRAVHVASLLAVVKVKDSRLYITFCERIPDIHSPFGSKRHHSRPCCKVSMTLVVRACLGILLRISMRPSPVKSEEFFPLSLNMLLDTGWYTRESKTCQKRPEVA